MPVSASNPHWAWTVLATSMRKTSAVLTFIRWSAGSGAEPSCKLLPKASHRSEVRGQRPESREQRAESKGQRAKGRERPALDKRAGRAEYRNDDGNSSAPILCGCRGG